MHKMTQNFAARQFQSAKHRLSERGLGGNTNFLFDSGKILSYFWGNLSKKTGECSPVQLLNVQES
jgi:hypothetical protein